MRFILLPSNIPDIIEVSDINIVGISSIRDIF